MTDQPPTTSTSTPATAASTASTTSSSPKRAGIVLAAEKRVTSKLLDKDAGGGREKILGINRYAIQAIDHLSSPLKRWAQ